MVTPSECFFSSCSEKGVGVGLMMPGVFARLTRWCLRSAVCIWDDAVGVDEFWLVVVGLGVMFSVVVLIFFSSCCNDYSWRPWKVWFSFLIF